VPYEERLKNYEAKRALIFKNNLNRNKIRAKRFWDKVRKSRNSKGTKLS